MVAGQSTCPPAAYLITDTTTRSYCEVRDAVAAASPGATVAIVPALAPYREAIHIGPNLAGLTLCPASGDGTGCTERPFTRPTLDATGFDAPALTITASDVTVRGIGLQGATPVVRVQPADDVLLEGLLVVTQTSTTRATDGIQLTGTQSATVRMSEVRGNLYPGSAGIRATDTADTLLDGNRLTQSGTAVAIHGGERALVRANTITVSAIGTDAAASTGIRVTLGRDHATDRNLIDGVGTGILDAGSAALRLASDTIRSVPLGVRLTSGSGTSPVGTVLRDVGLAGADTALQIDGSVQGAHIDAACNDWGVYSTKTIGDARIRDDGTNNTITYTPYKAPTTDGLRCLRLPTAAFAHDPLIADRLTDVRFTSAAMDGSYPVVAHAWSFGDGSASDARHPVHRYDAVGTFDVTLQVTDADGMTDTTVRPLVVRNHAPHVTPVPDQVIDEGSTIQVALEATDVEGDPVTWSLSTTAGDARITTGPDGPRFTWTPDHFQAGTHTFVVKAHDGYDTTQRTLNITVADIEGAPAILPLGPVDAREGVPITVHVAAVDPEGTVPALAVFVLPPGATFTDHGDGTGTFAWTPGYFQAGDHALTVQASDGLRIDQEPLLIRVADTNRAPTLLPVADRTLGVGETGAFVVSATDADGDALAITLDPIPKGASWDAATRRFTWTPTAAQAGEGWQLTATADDGKGGVATATFWIHVAGDVRYGVRALATSRLVVDAIPGDVARHGFTVHNTGTTTRTFALQLDRIPVGWDARLAAPTVTLQPGETRALTLDIVPDGRHAIGRVDLRIDDGIVTDAVTFNTIVPLDIRIEVQDKIPVRGIVQVRYLDGRPLAGRSLEVIESTGSGGVRTLRGETDAAGVFRFDYGLDPLGSGMPGDHDIKVRVHRIGGNSWGHGAYRIG